MVTRLCWPPWRLFSYANIPFGRFVPLFGNVQSKSAFPGGHDSACEQSEVYLEQSLGGTEVGALLRRQLHCRGQPLCPFKFPGLLVWQMFYIESLSVVLGDSAFDHCEFLGSVTVAVENCQDAWGGVGIIRADRLLRCVFPAVQCLRVHMMSVASSRVESPCRQEEGT